MAGSRPTRAAAAPERVRARAAARARQTSFPLGFAARRVVAARRQLSVAGFGIAIASCALAAALAASSIVENRAVADAIDALAARGRDVEVTWVGLGRSASERAHVLVEQVGTTIICATMTR
jgi:hypothetical protein